jgi:hypothetical protein
VPSRARLTPLLEGSPAVNGGLLSPATTTPNEVLERRRAVPPRSCGGPRACRGRPSACARCRLGRGKPVLRRLLERRARRGSERALAPGSLRVGAPSTGLGQRREGLADGPPVVRRVGLGLVGGAEVQWPPTPTRQRAAWRTVMPSARPLRGGAHPHTCTSVPGEASGSRWRTSSGPCARRRPASAPRRARGEPITSS